MNMFYGASHAIFQRAQELRSTMTTAEEILWNVLGINNWKLKFRRQHPVANYVVDFYCHRIKLVIELDGAIHEVEEVKRHDTHRERHLKEFGLTVLRFKNVDVLNDTNGVLRTVEHAIEERSSSL